MCCTCPQCTHVAPCRLVAAASGSHALHLLPLTVCRRLHRPQTRRSTWLSWPRAPTWCTCRRPAPAPSAPASTPCRWAPASFKPGADAGRRTTQEPQHPRRGAAGWVRQLQHHMAGMAVLCRSAARRARERERAGLFTYAMLSTAFSRHACFSLPSFRLDTTAFRRDGIASVAAPADLSSSRRCGRQEVYICRGEFGWNACCFCVVGYGIFPIRAGARGTECGRHLSNNFIDTPTPAHWAVNNHLGSIHSSISACKGTQGLSSFRNSSGTVPAQGPTFRGLLRALSFEEHN